MSTLTLLMHGPTHIALLSCALSLVAFTATRVILERRRNPLRLPLPPGPKGYPIIGNLLDLPKLHPWRTYYQWSKIYGDILSLHALGQHIIVLNSPEVTQAMFDRRSANYSDRPQMPILELMGYNSAFFTLMPYGPSWRRHRRGFMEHFQEKMVPRYHSDQGREARGFLNKLLQSPDRLDFHIRETLASNLTKVLYGIKIKGFDDPYVRNVEECLHWFNIAGKPGAFLVDLIPALKYVPGWVPGAGFRKTAAYVADLNRKLVEVPFNQVRKQMKEGTAGPSVAASMISALPEAEGRTSAEDIRNAQLVPAVAYAAGVDTTMSAIQTFFLAMALYPEVQRRAQAELDAIVGKQRLPEFSDRPSLPYINAVIKETLRWQLVVPLGIPHMATEDDVFQGYFIPKGSIILGNAWAILHDEGTFENPEEYRPERYLIDGQLNLSVLQPEAGAFGFGRRICPGQHFANDSLFIIIASSLHVFNITPKVNANGEPVQLAPEMTSGVVSYPEAYQVNLEPRSAAAESLVKDAVLLDNLT